MNPPHTFFLFHLFRLLISLSVFFPLSSSTSTLSFSALSTLSYDVPLFTEHNTFLHLRKHLYGRHTWRVNKTKVPTNCCSYNEQWVYLNCSGEWYLSRGVVPWYSPGKHSIRRGGGNTDKIRLSQSSPVKAMKDWRYLITLAYGVKLHGFVQRGSGRCRGMQSANEKGN